MNGLEKQRVKEASDSYFNTVGDAVVLIVFATSMPGSMFASKGDNTRTMNANAQYVMKHGNIRT